MAISVIVSNFNGANYLPRLLETLEAQREVSLEIIVVDRNSTDGSAEILARHPDVKVVKEPPESGLVAGYASGLRYAHHNNIFFCNEDMWLSRDCLLRLENVLNRKPRCGAVMPAQLTYNGDAVVNSGVWFRRGRWDRVSPFPFRQWIFRVTKETAIVSGINAGACLVRRKAYEEVGGWDTTFFLDYEDGDLSLRFWQHSWKCNVEPRARVFHAVGASNNKNIENGKAKVGAKRYVWQFSNQITIILKYFEGVSLAIAPFLWIDRFGRDLLNARFSNVWLDCRVFGVTVLRLPTILRFRHENREWNVRRPGQRFYCDPAFDADALPLESFQSAKEFLVEVRSQFEREYAHLDVASSVSRGI